MKVQNKVGRVMALSSVLFSVAAITLSFVFVPPRAQAATGANILVNMANKCNGIERTEQTSSGNAGRGGSVGQTMPSGVWGECQAMQGTLKDNLGCSDRMFYAKKDPQDSSAELNEWYIDADAYKACFAKARSKLETVSGDKCKRMVHGDKVSDSDNWKNCEKEQNRLHDALGCSDRMFRKLDDKYFTQDTSALNDCSSRVKAVGNVKIIKSDGTPDSETAEQGANARGLTGAKGEGDGGDGQADCDAKWTSPLSWIICPVIDIGAGLSDFVFSDIVSPLLKDVPVKTDPEDGGYKVWQQFRLLGNVLLVGSLLAVVYSQAKGGK